MNAEGYRYPCVLCVVPIDRAASTTRSGSETITVKVCRLPSAASGSGPFASTVHRPANVCRGTEEAAREFRIPSHLKWREVREGGGWGQKGFWPLFSGEIFTITTGNARAAIRPRRQGPKLCALIYVECKFRNVKIAGSGDVSLT